MAEVEQKTTETYEVALQVGSIVKLGERDARRLGFEYGRVTKMWHDCIPYISGKWGDSSHAVDHIEELEVVGYKLGWEHV